MTPKRHQQPTDIGLLYKTQTRWLFHCHIKIKIPVFCDERLFDEFFEILSGVDKQYNSYSDGSYIDRINKNAGDFVDVDDETISILNQLKTLSDIFEGEYDITVMPLIRLWGFYKDEVKKVPTAEDIVSAKKNVNYKNIDIDGNRVRIAKGQEIITGSFIKSYAVDRLVDYILSLGINDALVNAGGSTIRAINNKVHPFWKIGIDQPQTEQTELLKIGLTNSCYSTSAQNKTFIAIDGKQYGHIISPITGYPSENLQIGIISDTCFVGDVISTGLFNQSLGVFSEKMDVLNTLFPVAGFLIDKNNNIQFSNDFESFRIT